MREKSSKLRVLLLRKIPPDTVTVPAVPAAVPPVAVT
jgi:hypothetical protein